MTIQDVIQLS